MTAPTVIPVRATPSRLQLDCPELELLVCCARLQMDAESRRRFQALLACELDWNATLQYAERHRLVPLLYRQLAQLAPERLKRPELSAISARARGIAGRNLQLTQELLRLLDLFEQHQIPAIPIKGPLLAVQAFGSLSGREFEDLDILIAREQIDHAIAVLEAQGYEPERKMTQPQKAAFLRSEHAFQFRRDGCRFVVELHWRLQDQYLSFPFDQQELWNTSTIVTVLGRPVRTLGARNLVLYLCMHGAKHYWERLEWISCLPALMRAEPGMDWPAVIAQAHRVGGLRILQLGLLLAHDLDGGRHTELPLRLIGADPIARQLAARVWKKLGADELSGTRREVYRFRFYLNTRERLSDRLRVVRFASIRIPHPNSSQWEDSPFPARLLFLYYFASPVRLLRKFGLQGLRGVFRPTEIP